MQWLLCGQTLLIRESCPLAMVALVWGSELDRRTTEPKLDRGEKEGSPYAGGNRFYMILVFAASQ